MDLIRVDGDRLKRDCPSDPPLDRLKYPVALVCSGVHCVTRVRGPFVQYQPMRNTGTDFAVRTEGGDSNPRDPVRGLPVFKVREEVLELAC